MLLHAPFWGSCLYWHAVELMLGFLGGSCHVTMMGACRPNSMLPCLVDQAWSGQATQGLALRRFSIFTITSRRRSFHARKNQTLQASY